MKHTRFHRIVTGCLSVCLTAALAFPAFASGSAEYITPEGQEHTILWMEGLAEQPMPSKEDKGQFTLQKVFYAGSAYQVYERPYRDALGWYDLAQDPYQDYNSGYAAAAANLTHWWLQNNQKNLEEYLLRKPVQKEVPQLASPDKLYDLTAAPALQNGPDSPIYNLYMEMFPEESKPDYLLDAFFNGYMAPESGANEAENFKPNPKGGFFYPVFGKKLLTRREEINSRNIKDAIAENDGVILGLTKGDELRYVNVWGAEIDKDTVLRAIYITDSSDDLGLVRFEVTEKDDVLTAADHQISEFYVLQLGEAGWMDYTPADKPGKPDGQKPDEQKPEGSGEATVWKAPTYEWAGDLSSCTARREAENDPEKTETEQVKASSEQTRKPSPEEPGIMTYTADFDADWADTQTKTREIPKEDLQWGKPTYQWDQGNRTCTATRLSLSEPVRKQTAEGVISGKETREPTCLQKGQTTYTAEFEEDWAETQTKVADDVPVLEPIWGPTEYQWSEDHRSCTAVRVCKHEPDGAHRETVQAVNIFAERTKNPTSRHPGETTYTARFNVDWAKPQTVTAADVPSLNADWTAPTYEWSRDMRICTATRTDKNDGNRVETAEVGVTSRETKAPTCTAEGETTYTAKFEEDWAGTQTKVVADIPRLTPSWGKTEYEWSQDHRSCTAIRTCKNEKDHVETAHAVVKSQRTKNPTLTEEGETTYRAEFGVDWAETQTVTLENVPKLKDEWYAPQYEWQNDNTRCVATRKNKGDTDTVQTAVASVSSRKSKAPTSVDKGETTYTARFQEDWAKTQTRTVANIPPVTGPTHSGNQTPGQNGSRPGTEKVSWTDPVYEWSQDFSRCTASRSRTNDKSNVDLTWATVTRKETKAPTCSQKGEAVVTAKFTEKWAKDQKKTIELDTLDHKLQKVAEVPASAGKEGVREHYECSECHRLFSDPEGKHEVQAADLLLTRPSVTDGYAILSGVPEKENQVAIAPAKFTQALSDNPGSVGVSISVGKASVTYDKKDVETILSQAGDASKLQLEVYRTDASDSRLTLEQIQAADRNQNGSLYLVNLSYVKNGKNVPITGLSGTSVMVPYSGEASVQAYCMAEDGSFRQLESQYADAFVTFRGENGVYLLTEQEPAMPIEKHSSGKLGAIIWTSVLVVSGLLCLGLAGFYFYQKKLAADEEAAPHKFSKAREPKPRMDQNFSTDQVLDYDEGFFDDPSDPVGDYQSYADAVESADQPGDGYRVPAEEAAKPKTAASRPVTPLAPKAPMEQPAKGEKKPTLAEKAVKAAAHEKPEEKTKA